MEKALDDERRGLSAQEVQHTRKHISEVTEQLVEDIKQKNEKITEELREGTSRHEKMINTLLSIQSNQTNKLTVLDAEINKSRKILMTQREEKQELAAAQEKLHAEMTAQKEDWEKKISKSTAVWKKLDQSLMCGVMKNSCDREIEMFCEDINKDFPEEKADLLMKIIAKVTSEVNKFYEKFESELADLENRLTDIKDEIRKKKEIIFEEELKRAKNKVLYENYRVKIQKMKSSSQKQ